MTSRAGTWRIGEHGGWPDFEVGLASVLAELDDEEYLILSVIEHGAYVQFRGEGADGMRIETTAEHFLPPPDRLPPDRLARLVDLGYRPPTVEPLPHGGSTDWEDSPNFHRDFADPVDFDAVARLAVITLAEVRHVPSPRALVYRAFRLDGKPLTFPELGIPDERQPRPRPRVA